MDDESLALDVIDAVGPGGHFLAQPHTRRHMRDAVVRSISQEIAADGQHYRDPVEVARERALDILENYRPEPLAGDVRDELRRIVDAADGEGQSASGAAAKGRAAPGHSAARGRRRGRGGRRRCGARGTAPAAPAATGGAGVTTTSLRAELHAVGAIRPRSRRRCRRPAAPRTGPAG